MIVHLSSELRLVTDEKFVAISPSRWSLAHTGKSPIVKENDGVRQMRVDRFLFFFCLRGRIRVVTYHLFSLRKKLLNLDLRGENLGITVSTNNFLSTMTNDLPSSDHLMASWFDSSPRTAINRFGKISACSSSCSDRSEW